jgi:hypothetical protein
MTKRGRVPSAQSRAQVGLDALKGVGPTAVPKEGYPWDPLTES